jgi:hypothetical protein
LEEVDGESCEITLRSCKFSFCVLLIPQKPEGNFDPKLNEEGIEPPQGKGSAVKLDFNDFTYAEKSVLH